MEVKKIVEVKREGKYHVSYTTEDATEVYKDLATALINKRLCRCAYINMIVRVPLYNGFTKKEAAEELCRKCGYARRFK